MISICAGIASAIVILADILHGRRQAMAIMGIVWPVTGLYGGPLALLAYFTIGRARNRAHASGPQRKLSFGQKVLIGTLHCGGGCTCGDLLAEGFLFFVPFVLWHSMLLGRWTIDFVFAFCAGIIFQYYAIRPMRHLPRVKILVEALKADSLSLISWQAGMYGWMAIAILGIYRRPLSPPEPLFWFMMQIAMMAGLITAYPINWWLLKKGIKSVM